MAKFHVLTGPDELVRFPAVRKIGFGDLIVSLREGWRDFWNKPSHLVFLGLIYPLVGGIIAVWTSGTNAWPLLFPLISGFALVGPLAALPLYEMSRHMEMGLDTSWNSVFSVVRSPAIPSIVAIGVMLLGIFTVWLMVAQYIYESVYGQGSPASFVEFYNQLTTMPQAFALLLWGNLVGLGFAIVVLATTVISLPLLLDRDVGAAVAIQTSIRAIAKNPIVMATWGLIVAALLILGSIPLLVGLAVVVPVLGHATWHLYRKVVVPAD